jgi:hypothetical protein
MKEPNRLLVATHNGRTVRIEPDFPEVGCYLLVFEGKTCVADHLQDTTEMCLRFAERQFGVPRDAWVDETG